MEGNGCFSHSQIHVYFNHRYIYIQVYILDTFKYLRYTLFISTFILNYQSSKSKFLERGSDWSDWREMSSLIHLFVRGRIWQEVNCPLSTQPLSRCCGDKHLKRELRNTEKTRGISKIKIGHYQCGHWPSSYVDKDEDLKKWQGTHHGRASRESTIFRMDSEYYKRTLSKRKKRTLSVKR